MIELTEEEFKSNPDKYTTQMAYIVNPSVAAQRRIIKIREEVEAEGGEFRLEEFLLDENNRKRFKYCYLQETL